MPQLDGSQGCSVALPLNTLASDKHYETVKACLYEIICSKCIITRALEVARKLWPCKRCKGKGEYVDFTKWVANDKPVDSKHLAETCCYCHGFGITKEAFWEECKLDTDHFVCKKGTLIAKVKGFESGLKCHNCKGTGQVKREPWDIIAKWVRPSRVNKIKAGYEEYLQGQFFLLFWLWEQLRLTFDKN